MKHKWIQTLECDDPIIIIFYKLNIKDTKENNFVVSNMDIFDVNKSPDFITISIVLDPHGTLRIRIKMMAIVYIVIVQIIIFYDYDEEALFF